MFSLNDVGFLGSLNQTPTDPNFANVSLLLHGDGTNGSTSILDSSPSPKTMTAVGDAQISTAQSKFGGASILFDGIADRITTPNSSDFAFGTGNFTVEAWVYIGTLTLFHSIVGTRTVNNNVSAWTLGANSSRQPYWYTDGFNITGDALSQSAWHHLAVTRSGSSLKMFANGTQVGSTFTDTKNYTVETLVVGSTTDGSQLWVGNIDDLRITKGISRYNSTFTAPTAPFPDA
jgi:hypothetical protein